LWSSWSAEDHRKDGKHTSPPKNGEADEKADTNEKQNRYKDGGNQSRATDGRRIIVVATTAAIAGHIRTTGTVIATAIAIAAAKGVVRVLLKIA